MKLVITGSRHGFQDLWTALDRVVSRLGKPTSVIVREQVGVDQDARAWVRARGLHLDPEQADMTVPNPRRYHEGNQRMADRCGPGDVCVGFPAPDSTGTYDCLRRCHARGMRCYIAEGKRVKTWEPRMKTRR